MAANMRTTSNNGENQLSKDVEKLLGNWKPPKVPIYDVFHRRGLFDFKPNYEIKRLEKTVKIHGERVDLQLLDWQAIQEHKRNYDCLHFGLVQIGVKPLTRNGLNSNVLVCLRDCRHLRFKESLLGVGESPLIDGPIYFNCYPNYSVSLIDPHILTTLTLNVKTIGLGDDIEVFYKVYYKVYVEEFYEDRNLRSKIRDSFVKNTVIQTNLLRNGVPVKRIIDWDSVEVLENGDFTINPTNQDEES